MSIKYVINISSPVYQIHQPSVVLHYVIQGYVVDGYVE